MTFKKGDKIRLKDYSKYWNHKEHLNQSAKINTIYGRELRRHSGFNCQIEWNDRVCSCADFVNMIMDKPKTWDEVINNEQR